jgi:hypothetical protein
VAYFVQILLCKQWKVLKLPAKLCVRSENKVACVQLRIFIAEGFSLGYYYIISGVSGHEILTKALSNTTQWIHKNTKWKSSKPFS